LSEDKLGDNVAQASGLFVSSFFQEGSERADSKLRWLRKSLHELNPPNRNDIWVDEYVCGLEPDSLATADRLVEKIRESQYYMCILAGERRGPNETGTLLTVNGEETNVSYFEIELYAAAMYSKPIIPYVLDGFDPGPRLKDLLSLLAWGLADWPTLHPQSADDILRSVKQHQREGFSSVVPSSRSQMVDALYRARAGELIDGESNLLFLGGFVDRHNRLPDRDRVEALIADASRATNFRSRLMRLWIAARALLPASYHPGDVQVDTRLNELLPLWDRVLGDWAAAASWHGWHGHLLAGTIAPISSQRLIRAQRPSTADHRSDDMLQPDGPFASAYYSVANLSSKFKRASLRRALDYVNRALRTSPKPDSLLAIRGCIRLRMGLQPLAALDFSRMLRLREKAGATDLEIADAEMHLGLAWAFLPSGRRRLERAVEVFSQHPNDPNLPRAKRWLALAYNLPFAPREKREALLAEADADAARIAAYDQYRRER
jgi:hypothetical protein